MGKKSVAAGGPRPPVLMSPRTPWPLEIPEHLRRYEREPDATGYQLEPRDVHSVLLWATPITRTDTVAVVKRYPSGDRPTRAVIVLVRDGKVVKESAPIMAAEEKAEALIDGVRDQSRGWMPGSQWVSFSIAFRDPARAFDDHIAILGARLIAATMREARRRRRGEVIPAESSAWLRRQLGRCLAETTTGGAR